MTTYKVNILIDQVIAALGAFLKPFVDPYEIVRGQTNRVAAPFGGYVNLTEINVSPLETPNSNYDGDLEQLLLTTPSKIEIQVDFYGPLSGDQCSAVTTVYRSRYAPGQLPDGIKPLYCSDGLQSPLVTGEHQYESRWTLRAFLQYNPTVAIPYQSATSLAIASVKEF